MLLVVVLAMAALVALGAWGFAVVARQEAAWAAGRRGEAGAGAPVDGQGSAP